ncbi:aspartate aminotransferase family protein [Candidatus Parabeggiatoa sp. HSG14]|uniref:aspartate aminotransferase family protein n=1 Tax=Candidatus Parabeggiatoa sp. HSG14 TaxID=3055593 RepID=UPI0025A8C9F6|nr:aspartate aminotransferase family protein [Thiotrichales bacterium HSG14]
MSATLMPNYARLPVTFVKGDGAWLWDTEGTRYLDALSGIAVCGLGHAHPAVTSAICEQANQLLHTSNIYGIAHQQTLADTLALLTGMETAFFGNSGAEANEAALKIARLYGHNLGIEKPTVIVTEGSFHGRTLATLTATGNPKIQAGFAPLLEGFIRVPYNNVDAIAKVAKQHPEVVAVLVEPVIGEGGIVIPDDDYLAKLRALCDSHNWLLMLDEIQTGMGRTGKWCAYQHTDILPDVLTLAKGLGNGVPIGTCLARGKVAEIFKAGTHGSTFGGNPLVCRTALAVIETIEKENLLQRTTELGQRFHQGFTKALEGIKGVQDIRVKGLMIGIELDKPCRELVSKALEQGLLINVTAERVVRLLPPLILSNTQADDIITTVSRIIREFLKAPVVH